MSNFLEGKQHQLSQPSHPLQLDFGRVFSLLPFSIIVPLPWIINHASTTIPNLIAATSTRSCWVPGVGNNSSKRNICVSNNNDTCYYYDCCFNRSPRSRSTHTAKAAAAATVANHADADMFRSFLESSKRWVSADPRFGILQSRLECT
jgi:hypothetical protein